MLTHAYIRMKAAPTPRNDPFNMCMMLLNVALALLLSDLMPCIRSERTRRTTAGPLSVGTPLAVLERFESNYRAVECPSL